MNAEKLHRCSRLQKKSVQSGVAVSFKMLIIID